MTDYHLAQLNIAHMQAPLDSPQLADFVANLDRINALAESSPGFVWRLVEDGEENATEVDQPFGDEYIVNLSVWESIELLHDYVYRSDHINVLRRKLEWFDRMPRAHMVLWWIPEGQLPDVAEAAGKLAHLQANGPTATAFTFRQAFARPV